MRKFSLVLVAAMLLSAGSVFANDSKSKKNVEPAKNLSSQIAKLLDDNNFIIENDITADVRFTLNSNKEIVVLSVKTEDETLEGFVKSRLNYKKVDLTEYREGRTYTVPVRITES